MKHEIGAEKPACLKEYWPGQYDFFSHFEYLAGVPQPLFLITTFKENGKPNICFHGWSSFAGDGAGFFAVMPGLGMHTHTYKNILRDKEFCVSFISPEYYDAAIKTINAADDEDEFNLGGFTTEPAAKVKAPRVKEAFLTYECTLKSAEDLSGAGKTALIVGAVIHAAVEEGYHEVNNICGDKGFMFNTHSPKNPADGAGKTTAVSVLSVARIFEE